VKDFLEKITKELSELVSTEEKIHYINESIKRAETSSSVIIIPENLT
jgi:hypothetical protein